MSLNKEIFNILREARLVSSNPIAVKMVGPNLIAPSCPQTGVLGCYTWAVNTSGLSWREGTAPEGWDKLVQMTADGECPPFAIVRPTEDSTIGWCLPLNSICYVPLYDSLTISEVTDWITDMVGDYTGHYDEDDDEDDDWEIDPNPAIAEVERAIDAD